MCFQHSPQFASEMRCAEVTTLCAQQCLDLHHKNKKLTKDSKNRSMSYLQRNQTTMEIQIQLYSHILSVLSRLNLVFFPGVYIKGLFMMYTVMSVKSSWRKKIYSVISLKQITNGGR